MLGNSRGRLGWVLVAILLVTACGGGTSTTGATATPAASKTARIGSFDRPIIFAFTPSQDVARITASGTAIASALATATGLRWKVTVPTSYAAQIESVCAGQTDIAAIAPLQMTLLLDKSCGTPILSALRKDDTGQLATTYKPQGDHHRRPDPERWHRRREGLPRRPAGAGLQGAHRLLRVRRRQGPVQGTVRLGRAADSGRKLLRPGA